MSDDLREAKQRLLAAAEAYQPLGYVRQKPLRCIGMAFAAGFLSGKSGPPGGALAMLPALLHALSLVQKLAGFPRG